MKLTTGDNFTDDLGSSFDLKKKMFLGLQIYQTTTTSAIVYKLQSIQVIQYPLFQLFADQKTGKPYITREKAY